MQVIDWFSGIGGFRLGLEPLGFEFIAHSEIDDYAEKVYQKHWPGCTNLGDIKRIKADDIPPSDLWCGGFPCQPFSVAGKRLADRDDRDLWPVWFDLLSNCRPRYLFAENVPALLTANGGSYFGGILRDLASAGYVVEWTVIGADDVGAPHRRKRLWIWAHLPNASRPEREPGAGRRGVWEGSEELAPGWAIDPADVGYSDVARQDALAAKGGPRGAIGESSSADVAYSESQQRYGGRRSWAGWPRHPDGGCPFCGADQGPTSPVLGRVAHGIPDRTHRLRCLGNAVVPQVVNWIGRRILAASSAAATGG